MNDNLRFPDRDERVSNLTTRHLQDLVEIIADLATPMFFLDNLLHWHISKTNCDGNAAMTFVDYAYGKVYIRIDMHEVQDWRWLWEVLVHEVCHAATADILRARDVIAQTIEEPEEGSVALEQFRLAFRDGLERITVRFERMLLAHYPWEWAKEDVEVRSVLKSAGIDPETL